MRIFKRLIKDQVLTEEQIKGIKSEIIYRTSRSGGSGGQHVNKTETRVQVEFDISMSFFLNEGQKERLLRTTGRETVQFSSDKHRSQTDNKQEAVNKLISFLIRTLKPVKKRKATAPTYASRRKRSESKKKLSEKKQMRRRPTGET